MSQKNIDFGNYPDDPDADSIRTAFDKVQQNFTQLFAPTGAEAAVTSVNRTPGAGITVNAPTGNVVISANIACVQVHTSTLSIGRGTNGFQDTSITSSSQTLWVDLPDTIANVTNIDLGGNADIGGYANITGNIIAGNANLGNAVTANYFVGDGSLLTNLAVTGDKISNGSSNVSVALNGNVTVGIGGTPNIAVFSAGGANLGNAVSANFFIGDGGLLSNISGGGGANLGNLTVSNVSIGTVNNGDPIQFTPTSPEYTSWIDQYNLTQDISYWSGTAVDSLNNVYLIGSAESSIDSIPKAIVVKYDSFGNLLWQQTYTLGAQDVIYGQDIVLDSSNNPIVTIQKPNNGIYISKLDGITGNIIWSTKINQGAPYYLRPALCIDSSDNSYVSFTYNGTGRIIGVAKFDSSGNNVWYSDNNVDGLNNEGSATSITVDPSGNVYVIGYQKVTPPAAGFILKYNSSGTLTATRLIDDFSVSAITADSAGNIYVSGVTIISNQFTITKLDSSFTQLWSYYFTGISASSSGLITDGSNNVYLSFNPGASIYLFKFNSTGTLQWQRELSSPAFDALYSGGSNTVLDVNSTRLVLAASNNLNSVSQPVVFNLLNTGAQTGTYGDYIYAALSATTASYTISLSTLTFTTPASPVTFTGSNLVYSTIDNTNTLTVVGTPTYFATTAQINNDGTVSTSTVTLGNSTVTTTNSGSNISLSVDNVSPSTFWFNNYGGNVAVDDYTNFWLYSDGVATDSGGNVFAYGGNDGDFGAPILIKYNSTGTLVWQKVITTDINVDWIAAQSLICDSNDDLIVTYFRYANQPSYASSSYVIKLDNNGTILWQTEITNPAAINGDVVALASIDANDNIYVGVASEPQEFNPCVIKLNSSGTEQWNVEVTGLTTFDIYGFHADTTGNTYMVGTSDVSATIRGRFIKIDPTGIVTVNKYFLSGPNVYPMSVASDPEGNYYICIKDSASNSFIMKFDSTDVMVWQQASFNSETISGSFNAQTIQYFNGVLYIYGYSPNQAFNGTVIMAMSALTGSVLWQNLITASFPYGFYSYYYDVSSALSVSENGIALAATTDYNISDMTTMILPLDGSGLGTYGYYTYEGTNIIFTNNGVSSSDEAITYTTGTCVLGEGTTSTSALTYNSYSTPMFTTGVKSLELNTRGQIVFPDGSVQSTAFDPFASSTNIRNLTVNDINYTGKSIAIGANAVTTRYGISIGYEAGKNQLYSETFPIYDTIAIGHAAQNQYPQANSVGIGFQAGWSLQGFDTIAIGKQAGLYYQGANSISIGAKAGYFSQGTNSIIINATGVEANGAGANTLTVKPIRNASSGNVLYYDSTTGEITYSTGGGGSGGSTISQTSWTGSTRTLQLTDPGTYIYTTESTNKTLYIPTNAETAIPVNSVINVLIKSANTVSVIANAGVTLYMVGVSSTGNRNINGYGMATLLKTETNVWFISGTGVY